MQSPASSNGGGRFAAILVAIVAMTAFVGLGSRELWNPVEPRYAGVASHLVDQGFRWVPRYQDAAYDQKPPLVFWAVAGLHRFAGVERSLWMMRLPSALGLLAMVLGVFALARNFFRRRAALAAGLVLATAVLPVWSARFFHLDTLITASLVGIFAVAWRRIASVEVAADRDAGPSWIPLLGGALIATLGLFVKGPVALAFAGLVLGASALALRDRRVFLRSGWITMALVALAAAALWFAIAAAVEGRAWGRELLLEQGLLRLASDAPPKKHGPFYYLVSWFTTLAPWSLFLPFALIAVRRASDLEPRERRGLVFAATWMIAITVVLSLGVTKRSRYLMLALPGAALLLGWFFDRVLAFPDRPLARAARTLAFVLGGALTGTLALGLLGGELIAGLLPLEAEATAILSDVLAAPQAWMLGVVALVLAVAAGVRRRRADAPFGLLLGALVLGWCTWGLAVAPALDQARGERAFLERLRPLIAEGRELWAVGHAGHRESSWGWFHYYTGQAVRVDDERHRRLAEAARTRPVVAIWDGRFSETGGRHPVPRSFRRINRDRLGRRGYYIYLGGPDQ